jgi:hypothetical protein
MKIELHYFIRNNGDGSASALFYNSQAEMEAAMKKEDDDWGEGFTDNGMSETIEVDENGKVLNLVDGSFRERKIK